MARDCPYLVNVKGLSPDEAKQIALEYLKACNEVRMINDNISRLVNYYIEYAYKKGLKPLNLKTLKTKYSDLI